MYPKNAASPPEITVGTVVQISDGAIQTTGTTTKVKPKGGSWTAAGGTTTFGDGGTACYTPTQAETNYESFEIEVYKASCLPAATTIITTATSTAGTVVVTTNNDKTGYSSDIVSISGDATAADNLEAQFDGTGLIGSNYPAYQAQVRDIAVTGSALNATAESFTKTYGTETGTYANTQLANATYHQIAAENAGGTPYNIDGFYQFDVGVDGVPVEVTILGRLVEGSAPYGGDTVDTYAWDWVGSAWDHISPATGDFIGSSSPTDVVKVMSLLSKHVGTGGNDGKVRIRLAGTALESGTILYIDQILVKYANPMTVAAISTGVWAATTRTLSSFGTLVADIWASATRTLTSISDSTGITTLLNRIIGTLASGTHNPQSGDSYARLGAPAGASVSADIAGITATVDEAAIADAVWDEVISDHAGVGSTGAALAAAGGSGDPWATALPGAYGVGTAGAIIGGLSGGLAGAGAITWTYTLTEFGTGNPISDADVWVTSDSGGTNILASGRTNASGMVTFYLDAGTVYIWRQKSGWNFTNPDTESVS